MAASVSPLRSSFRICSPLTLHHDCCRAKLRMHRKCESQRRHLHQSATRHAAVVISGTELARQLHREIQRDVEELVAQGNMRPHLGVVLVGDDPASRTYVRNKTGQPASLLTCISSDTVVRPSSVSQEELLELIDKMNRDWRVSGLLVQLPLPEHINERAVCNAIAPEKDVDGFHIVNIGKLCLDQRSMVPATPAAVWEIIKRAGIETVGKNVLVAGRSKNVGMPIAMLLHTDRNHERPGGDATVTIAHRCTPRERLKELTSLADIIIAAAGVPGLITADMVKEGAAVIDVGINRIQDPKTGKVRLIGDVDFEGVKEKAGVITPVPGGVGPMTLNIKAPQKLVADHTAQAEGVELIAPDVTHGTEDKMFTPRQNYLQMALYSAVAVLVLLTTVGQSAVISDNLQTTETPSPTAEADNATMEGPRVLRSHRSCGSEHENYCENGGECMYPQDSDKPFCICTSSYSGTRCHFFSDHTRTLPELEQLIGIIFGVFMLIFFFAIMIYCFARKKCLKSPPLIKYAPSETSESCCFGHAFSPEVSHLDCKLQTAPLYLQGREKIALMWCERGFYGPRCAKVEFVIRQLGEEQIILTVFCVSLLIIGLAGALYFCCKWYKKNSFLPHQRRQGYKGHHTHTLHRQKKSQPGFSPVF
ncbi:hypothetical protein INR49_017255 [Caranx melampygus]|nr:hypothetical protein INR49_017255 [Caranx melampygus]